MGPAARADAGQPGSEPRRVPLRGLVLAIFGYQVLVAVVTQLLDYIVWERAAARYPNADDLARFQGLYNAVLNILAIGFVVLLAGRLLNRYGVKLGLAGTPAAAVGCWSWGTSSGGRSESAAWPSSWSRARSRWATSPTA